MLRSHKVQEFRGAEDVSEKLSSKFFAYLSRLRWIKRWGLMRNAQAENVMEHSWEVATIAHALALIKNQYFAGNVDPQAIATAALYHDVSEVITGDLPTPIKYYSKQITAAYHEIEHQSVQALIKQLPDKLQPEYEGLIQESKLPPSHREIIKAADNISAYLKCQIELKAGNQEFSIAAIEIEKKLRKQPLPEVDFFMQHFAPACGLTLDSLIGDTEEP